MKTTASYCLFPATRTRAVRLAAAASLLAIAAGIAHAGDQAPATAQLPKKTVRQEVMERQVTNLPSPLLNAAELGSVIPLPTGQGNAAEHYARLEALYDGEKNPERITVNPAGRGVQEILAASRIRACSLTPQYYPHMESGTSKQPDLVVFAAYRQGLLAYARDLEKQGDGAGAEQAYRAGLIWGWHLLQDRSNLVVLSLGSAILIGAADDYAEFLRRGLQFDRAHKIESLLESWRQQRRMLLAKAQVYLADFRNFNSLYALVQVARQDPDPLWRQEAVLRLGVLRHGAPNPQQGVLLKDAPSQKLAEDTLMAVASSDEKPWIRKLAAWSVQHITPDSFADLKRKLFIDALKDKHDPDTADQP